MSENPEDISIGGMRGVDLASFLLMVDNNSSLESIQDEFSLSLSEVKSFTQTAREKAVGFGGLKFMIEAVDPRSALHQKIKKQPPAGIAKTSIGLRDALFQTMEELREGRIDVKDALGVCSISAAICNTVRLEMDAEKLKQSSPKGRPLPHLSLGSDENG